MLGPEMALPSAQAPEAPAAAPSGPGAAAPVRGADSVRLAHHTHSPLVPGVQAAAWGRCWKWPPNRWAFNLFPGQWPLCPEEAASQAGGPEIALCVRPRTGLSITARPLPPDASLWWLTLIGLLDVETGGSWLCPLGEWPLKEPIVTTWK